MKPEAERVVVRFRKKPVEVEAMRWPRIRSRDSGISVRAQPFHDWIGEDFTEQAWDGQGYLYGRIKTLEGTMEAAPGDWIIKGIKGEFYPCKPDIFEATYERVEDGT